MRIVKRICVLSLALLTLTGCGKGRQETVTVFAMDTVMELTAWGKGAGPALEAAKSEIYRLAALFDRREPGGDIFKLNAAGESDVSPDTEALISRGLEIRGLTGGAFDMTVAPVMDLWGFYGQDYRVPSEDELTAALKSVGTEVEVNNGRVTLSPGAGLDVGGIAKGYTAGKIMEIFRENGVTSGLVSLGGNVQALGSRPDGSPWRVAIQDPDGDGYAAVLSLSDRAAVTSGDYQRYFEQDGKRYHHIIDPSTGFPAESGLRSVTVVAEDGSLADGLSTALFVLGEEGALELWRERGDFEAVFISGEGELTATSGLKGLLETDRPVKYVQCT